jgi:hypothetical protein
VANRKKVEPVSWRTIARVVLGVILMLLGLLWILQGADLIQIRPILCFADCQPLVGGSPLWLTIGVATLVIGLAITVLVRRRRR